MEWVLWLLAILLILLGIAGIILPMLPGILLVFAGLLLAAWVDDFSRVSLLSVGVIALVAVFAWALDFVASMATAKSAGGGRLALIGTVIGAFIGLVGGLPGLVLGTVIGAAVGELMENRSAGHATRVGLAAGLGFVLAMVVKLALAAVMLGIFAWSYFI